jgi:chorismate synthase
VKFGLDDIRDVIERASARETAMRCALGITAKKVLVEFGLKIISRVLRIADIEFEHKTLFPTKEELNGDFDSLSKEIEDVYQKKIPELKALREKLDSKGNTCGGAFQVIVHEMPVGLGSYTQADERLDSVLAQAIISIPSVKGFTIGSISNSYVRYGNDYVDEFTVINNRIYRKTNNAGGVEGGISNGEPLVISGFVKPVPTLASPKKTIDMFTHEEVNGFYENADLWVVEAAGVIAESMVALVLLDQVLRKYGGDSMDEIHRNLDF